jgi:hypothetical protein
MSQTGYTPIQLYRSATASTAPIAGNLAAGELAINTNDGKLYYKDSAGVVQTIASKAGASGDVVGPASATDNAIVRFDGTTGKLIQNSSVTIADDGTTIISVNSSTAALRITQIGAGNALLVEDSANPDSTPFVIDAGGAVGMGGTTVPAGNGFYNSKNITGASSAYANNTVANIQSDVGFGAAGYRTSIGLAASVTLNTLHHFQATQGTFTGAASGQIGFSSDSTLIGSAANYGFLAANTAATTNIAYGFFSSVNTPTAGGTTWGFYADGTANNLFRGNTYHGNTGVTPTAKIHVAAGSATASTAPLKFTSGTNLTAIEAGVVEYDGTIMTATPNANFKRGTIPITNYTSGVGTSLTIGSEATSQLLLPTANDRITLPIGTYFLNLACTFTRGTVSTTSAAARLNLLGGGTAVGTFSGMSISSIIEGGASSNFSFNAVNINANNILTAASTTVSGVYTITLRGVMKITTAGTIIPSYTLSANLASAGTATAPNVLYFQLQQMDSQSATVFGPANTGWG